MDSQEPLNSPWKATCRMPSKYANHAGVYLTLCAGSGRAEVPRRNTSSRRTITLMTPTMRVAICVDERPRRLTDPSGTPPFSREHQEDCGAGVAWNVGDVVSPTPTPDLRKESEDDRRRVENVVKPWMDEVPSWTAWISPRPAECPGPGWRRSQKLKAAKLKTSSLHSSASLKKSTLKILLFKETTAVMLFFLGLS